MKRIIAIFLTALAIPATAWSQTVGFTDARNKIVTLPAKALRIVSLTPAITETLFAAGAGSKLVGVTTYCNYPAETAKIAKIGGFSAKTVSVETIISLKPDLVLGELSSHALLAPALEEAGIRFAAVNLNSFEDIYALLETAGRVAGDEKTASASVASIKARVKAISDATSAVPEKNRPLVFWEIWNEPLMSAGPNSFIGRVLVAAGARNVFQNVKEDYPTVSFESIVAANPDFIMASETHGSNISNEKLALRPGWAGIRAVRLGNVALFDGDTVSRAGPRFVLALELISRRLYPGLFK